MGCGSFGCVLLLQVSSHLVSLLLQESSLHYFFVKTFLVYYSLCFRVRISFLSVTSYVIKPFFLFLSMQPLLRDAYEKNPMMIRAEAKELLEKCLQVLYYRDARSLNKVTSLQRDYLIIERECISLRATSLRLIHN